jgi:hypothetical protein
MISRSYDSASKGSDVGNEYPCLRACDGFFPVFGQSAASIEPCEGALDDPPSRNDFESFSRVGTLDDLDGPVADFRKSAAQFGTSVTAIRKNMQQIRMRTTDGVEHFRCLVPVLNPALRTTSPTMKPRVSVMIWRLRPLIRSPIARQANRIFAERGHHSPKHRRFPLFLWFDYQQRPQPDEGFCRAFPAPSPPEYG